MKLKKSLCLIVIIAAALFVAGCDNPEAPAGQNVVVAKEATPVTPPPPPPPPKPETGPHGFLTGPVIKVYGNLPNIVKCSLPSSFGGGESAKIGEYIFGVHVQTTNGTYIIQFQGDRAVTLASMIDVGTQLRFPTTFFVRSENASWNMDGNQNDNEYILFDKHKIALHGVRGLVWDQLIDIVSTNSVETK